MHGDQPDPGKPSSSQLVTSSFVRVGNLGLLQGSVQGSD